LLGAVAPVAVWHVVHTGWIAAGPLSTAADEVSYLAWTGIGSAGDASTTAAAAAAANIVVYAFVFSFYLGDAMPAGFILVITLAVLAAGGAIRRLRSDPALALSVAGVAAVTLAWPFNQ